jgi:hypothetical protein
VATQPLGRRGALSWSNGPVCFGGPRCGPPRNDYQRNQGTSWRLVGKEIIRINCRGASAAGEPAGCIRPRTAAIRPGRKKDIVGRGLVVIKVPVTPGIDERRVRIAEGLGVRGIGTGGNRQFRGVDEWATPFLSVAPRVTGKGEKKGVWRSCRVSRGIVAKLPFELLEALGQVREFGAAPRHAREFLGALGKPGRNRGEHREDRDHREELD